MSTLKNKIELLRNKIKNKREGTGNLFTWKPKQDAINRLIKKVGKNNYKFNQKDVDKLDDILGGIKKILSKNKYKKNSYNQNKKKKINAINNQVKKINRNLALLNTYENEKKTFKKNFYENKNITKNSAFIASQKLYTTGNMFNSPVNSWLNNTKKRKFNIMIYTQNQIEKVREHLKNRIPIYISGGPGIHINTELFQQLTNYQGNKNNIIKEKNKRLNEIYNAKDFNYVVISNMDICNEHGEHHETETNYHAIHAFAPVFDDVNSKDYKYFINGNGDLSQKINILFTNIFEGLLSYHFHLGKKDTPAIVISAIGTGAFLSKLSHKQQISIKNLYVKKIIESIKKYGDIIKIYIAYRDESYLSPEQNMRKIFEDAIEHETGLQHTLIGDLFSRQPENDGYKEVYYVNNWDDKSFIGNGLKHDASVDGFFVANAFRGFPIPNIQVNYNLLNNSYFHNNAIFNADFIQIVGLKQNNMRGGNPKIPIVERTTTLNLRKFLNALINGKFLSPNRGALKSFKNATGGNDYISLSIPKSRASKLYSHKGITFIMDTNTIPLYPTTSNRRGEEGEVYTKDEINLFNSLIAIYINPIFADKKVGDLDLCDLGYGSASIKTKLDYIFDGCDRCRLGVENLKEEFENAEKIIEKLNQELYNETMKKKRRERFNFQAKGKKKLEEMRKTLSKKINLECTRGLLNSIGIPLDITLGECVSEFVKKYQQKYNHNIKIVNRLP